MLDREEPPGLTWQRRHLVYQILAGDGPGITTWEQRVVNLFADYIANWGKMITYRGVLGGESVLFGWFFFVNFLVVMVGLKKINKQHYCQLSSIT